ncbi:MAG: sigma-54-dependent Fis family transcriptional regulator [Gemmatimonadetes bacterium]|nr:MAG: sigma-54-dependent Fis family transcriptional regulator [Gemmatimonadota bacterium]
MTQARILLVDDEPEMLENMERLLASEGYECRTLQNPLHFRDVMAEFHPHVVVTDLRMPGADGMTLLAAAKADDPRVPVILITAFGTVSAAVEAIQEGAFDFVTKPFTADQLFVAVERAVRYRGLVEENEALRTQLSTGAGHDFIGSSPPVVKLMDQIHRVAPTDANVLITGESGTGKELVARAIHRHSGRAEGPFVPVDCAALPEGLLESELFGHEKGAFTGAVARREGLLAEAHGGTAFLDEIGEMSLPLQAKLLRALEQGQIRPVGGTQTRDIDIRVVAATNRDLEEAVRKGEFREDLYYRLNVVHLRTPPLRARQGDIPILVRYFMEQVARDRPPPEISPDVWDVLEQYRWPGNVRQLRNLVERIVALDSDGRVTVSDLPPEIRFQSAGLDGAGVGAGEGDLLPFDYQEAKELALRQFHSRYLRQLLERHDGNISAAARAANVSRRTLHRWLAELRESGEDIG